MSASANPIYTKLVSLAPGGVLALPASAFEATGPLQRAIAESCAEATLRATGVEVQATAAGATLRGIGANAPFAGMQLAATFAPEGDGASMTLTATPLGAWSLASAWPALAETFAAELPLLQPSLTLASGAGLSFGGALGLGGSPWAGLAWLLGGVSSLQLGGPVLMTEAVPVFAWSAPIATVAVPGLAELRPTLTLSCSALATTTRGPPYAAQPALGLGASVPIGPGLPVAIDLEEPNGLVQVVAATEALSTNVLRTLGAFVGRELEGVLPSARGFEPAAYVTLRSLGFSLIPAQRRVGSIAFVLGTPAGASWPIAAGLEVEEVALQLVVPFESSYGPPFASAFGTLRVAGGELQISGSYGSGFALAAGLAAGSSIRLGELLDEYLPTRLEVDLELDRLEFNAVPAQSAWSLAADLRGDWGFEVGVVRVALTNAGVSLEHEPNASPATSGTITATAVIGGETREQFRFTGTWTLPQTFVLSGTFPNVELSALAAKLTGHGAPAGAPAVELTETTMTLALSPEARGAEVYEVSLVASARSGQTLLGSAAFDVRREANGFGFLVGFDLPVGWSPADLWAPLGTLFGALQFESSGMVVSTLASTAATLSTLRMPSVPATVGPGVTFFTSLKLAGGGLGYLGEVLPAGTELDLLALIDTATPANSTITALLTEPASNGAVQFREVRLSVQPATTRVEASISAQLTVGSGEWAETLTIRGGGSLVVEPQPDISLSIDITEWSEPFGIEHLVVNDFGLRVNLLETGLDVGLAGKVTIGQGEDVFSLTLGLGIADFEVPDWLVFALEPLPGKTLMLPSLIAAFVPDLELAKVPVLNAIGFKELSFYLVEDPGGITIAEHRYPQGIGLDCDVLLWSWELQLAVDVSASQGIRASGSVNEPIDLLEVLKLSDVTGTRGPAASIDTSGLMPAAASRAAAAAEPPPYLFLDGRLTLLAETYTLEAKVTRSSFEFDFGFTLLEAVGVTVACSLHDATHFSGSAAVEFDLDITLGPWTWEGIELMPAVHISGPRASAAISILVEPSVVFDLGFAFAFDWGSVHVSVEPHLTAAQLGSGLSELWSVVYDWLQEHLDVVWAEFKADAAKWAHAIEEGLFAIEADAEAVAHALHGFFDASLDEAADVLNTFAFEFEAKVAALVHWFAVTAAEAARALGDSVHSCAIESANALLTPPVGARTAPGPRPSAALFALTATPDGQRLLRHWHVHEAELRALARSDPGARERLRALRASEDVRLAAGIELLVAVRAAPQASEELVAAIDEALPALEPHRERGWDELGERLAR